MTIAFLIGRIIVAIYFLEGAYVHLFKHAGLVGYAASKGVRSPKVAVIGSGLLLLIGGLSVLLGVATVWGIAALILFLIPVTFTMHNFWKETDPMMRMNSRISFNKNMALVGLLLMTLAIATPWAYSAF